MDQISDKNQKIPLLKRRLLIINFACHQYNKFGFTIFKKYYDTKNTIWKSSLQ